MSGFALGPTSEWKSSTSNIALPDSTTRIHPRHHCQVGHEILPCFNLRDDGPWKGTVVDQRTVAQNSHELRHKYLATCSSARSYRSLIRSFPTGCFAQSLIYLLPLLIHSFARTVHYTTQRSGNFGAHFARIYRQNPIIRCAGQIYSYTFME